MVESGAEDILNELSREEIQSTLDTLMGDSTFSFMDYVTSIIQGQIPFDPTDMIKQVVHGVFGNIEQQKSMLLYVLLLAVVGAVITNFSRLMQGTQVAKTAFYGVDGGIYAGKYIGIADAVELVRFYQGIDTVLFY